MVESRGSRAERQTQISALWFLLSTLDHQLLTIQQPDQDLNLEYLVRSEA